MLRKLIKLLEADDNSMYIYICIKIICYVSVIACIIILAMETGK